MIDGRQRLRLLGLEMELQRQWLAAYLQDTETRAAMRKRSLVWRLLRSVATTRSLWIAVIGAGLQWWQQRPPRQRAAA